jgi:hypothetical protein
MALSAELTPPSFYHWLIAQTCFQRSRTTNDRVRANALCESGRSYLAKAWPQGPDRTKIDRGGAGAEQPTVAATSCGAMVGCSSIGRWDPDAP